MNERIKTKQKKKKTILSNKMQSVKKKEKQANTSSGNVSNELSRQRTGEISFSQNQKQPEINTIYEDDISDTCESSSYVPSNKLGYCELCGDDVEKEGFKVCSWHALSRRNEYNKIIYVAECKHALHKYADLQTYLNFVREKREEIMENILKS